MNKKGDFESILFAVISIFIIGVIIFFGSHMNGKIYDAIDRDFVNKSYNNTEAQRALQDIKNAETSNMWDYAFLGVFIGVLMALGLTGYSVRISPIFYWIYGIFSLIVLFVAVILANTWQNLAANPNFSTTITRFPITNFILGTYYPTIVTGMVVIVMILLFSKTSEGAP